MKIQQKADSDQYLVKSVHCKQLGSVQIIKYRTHIIKGKKQIGTAVNNPHSTKLLATASTSFSSSSPRAESARAVTGRRCPHSGEGEDFLTGQLNFFYENCCNSGTESRKIDPKVGN